MSNRRPTFFARYALVILIVLFFLIPFAFRGARIAVARMKNDVKDWLPSTYTETAELDWFKRHFLGEQFVIVTWDGCKGDAKDDRFKLFTAKLSPETPPSERAKDTPAAETDVMPAETPAPQEAAAEDIAEVEEIEVASIADVPHVGPTKLIPNGDFIGDTYSLHTTDSDHLNWGHRGERWLKGSIYRADATGKSQIAESRWFFLTPEGDLYLWNAVDAPVAALWRNAYQAWTKKPVEGTLVHSFGPQDGPWYFENIKRLRARLFKSITTGPDVLASLTREGGVLHDDPDEALRRLSGTLFSRDGNQTCVLITLTDVARKDLHQIVGRGLLGKPRGRLFEIAEECSISCDALRMGGPPIDNVAIDEEGSITLVRLIGLCAVVGFGLSFACFRSFSATIMVFFVGGLSAVISLAFVFWLGSSVDAITMSMPALVYVLGLSGAAHIVNYYTEAVSEHGHEGACETAVRHGWKPALFCNITTAIGLISLYTSEIVPIRKFGIFAALGVMVTLVLTFTFLPAALQIWPQKRRKQVTEGDGWLDRLLSGVWHRLANICIRHHWLVQTCCLAIIMAIGAGVTKIQTSVNLLKMFHGEAKIIQDYVWLEERLGQLVPMEIVLRVDKSAQLPSARERAAQTADNPNEQFQLSFLERMELTDHIQRTLEEEFGERGQNKIGRAMSAATFAPKMPEAKGDTGTFARRGATGRLLETHRDEFLHSDYLRMEQNSDAELWRISLRLPATRGFNRAEPSIDYGDFVKDLKRVVEPMLAAQQCRENVLRSLVQARGQRPAGANVLVLGVPAEPAEGAPHEVNPTRIFARELIGALQTARIRVQSHVADGAEFPANFDQVVAAQDIVVIVSNPGCYNLAGIQAQAKAVLNATDHAFDPVAANVQTAYERKETLSAVYTGVVPIVYKAQRALLDSLIASTFWSFVTITPLMIFVARGLWAGLVAMLPNVLPVLVIFGGMGWLGIDVDVGSMMTASIALGVAVDDTIHYLNWFREELDRVGDRKLAILGAYKHCATPTFQSAIISGLGLSIFALSTFTPTQRFGYLMLAILWAGVAAELVFFPAILAGPLGAVYQPRKKKVAADVKPQVVAAEAEAPAAVVETVIESQQEAPVETKRKPLSVPPIPKQAPLPAVATLAEAFNLPLAEAPSLAFHLDELKVPPLPPPPLPPPVALPAAPTESVVPAPHTGRSKSGVLKILRQDRSQN